jgi:leucyl aminopeptidase
MKIRHVPAAPRGDLAIVLCADGALDAGDALAEQVAAAQATGDLATGFRKRVVFHQPAGARGRRSGPKRLGFVGLGAGKDVTTERLRRAAAMALASARELGVATLELVLARGAHGGVPASAAGRAIAEGLLLGSYQYDAPRRQKPAAAKPVAVDLATPGLGKADAGQFAAGLHDGQVAGAATNFARDLENLPSNYCTPTYLAKQARQLAGGRLKVKVLDTPAMRKLGMGALLGVAKGSTEPPKFLVLEYRVPGAKGNVCVVGKGLTFDTGGISIKPAAKMDEMRYDMCGAGAVLGLFHALAHGGLGSHRPKHNIIGLIAATENMPGPDAQKPGDVVTAMDGHTIEVLNTDAEGRLVLADAICYGKKFYAPKQIVDLATLTGAVVVALGHECAGIMGNNQPLVDALMAAGCAADEPLWQLPLWDCHKEQVKSKFADLANINGPQYGNGSTAGGAFLSYFAGDTPWVHLDIAGAAYGAVAKDYYTSGATGTAVRTLLHWVRTL